MRTVHYKRQAITVERILSAALPPLKCCSLLIHAILDSYGIQSGHWQGGLYVRHEEAAPHETRGKSSNFRVLAMQEIISQAQRPSLPCRMGVKIKGKHEAVMEGM